MWQRAQSSLVGSNMNSKIHTPRGFTLIELLIGIGVLSIVSGLAIVVFLTTSASYDKADVVARLNSDGNQIMETVTRAIRNARNASDVSGTELLLEYDKSSQNLEYANNGNCTQVRFHILNASMYKQTPVAGSCAGGVSCECVNANPDCGGATACKLNSDNVSIANLSISTVDGGNNPDRVTVSFTLTQDASLSSPDASQQSRLDFTRTITTRGY